MMIFTSARRPPPAAPWTARPTMSISMLTAVPHSALPRKHIATAIRRRIFRPQISLSFPQFGVAADAARRYAEPTQTYPSPEWKSLLIVGRAVVIMVVSSAARKTDIWLG